MNEEYELILQCYRSGQMSEAQWQAHLSDDGFRAWHDLNVAAAQPAAPAQKVSGDALSAFINHTKRLYTGDPKNHKDWPAFRAGFEAAQQSVPDGWKLVPVVPTPEMIAKLPGHCWKYNAGEHLSDIAVNAYQAILAAAPTPQAGWQAQQDVDPCPQCVPSGFCKTPMCGRLLKLQQDAEKVDACVAPVSDKPTCGAQNSKCERQQGADKVDLQAAPIKAIGDLLSDAMDSAVANGADSRSMPDSYVEVAAWLCGIPPVPTAQPDPAMASQDWIDRMAHLMVDLCMDDDAAAEIMVHARKRVQPASAEDAKRIAWLSENDCMIERLVSTKGTRYRLSWGDTWQSDWYDTPGQAIDAAMQHGGQS